MKEEKLIHIKLDYIESLQSKRNILVSEKEIIKIIQTIRRYKRIRSQEMIKRILLKRKIRELHEDFKKIIKNMPQLRIESEKVSEESPIEALEEQIEETREMQYDKDLEEQLREIQERLNSISR